MLLARLALWCVILLGFGPCSAGNGLKMDSTFWGEPLSWHKLFGRSIHALRTHLRPVPFYACPAFTCMRASPLSPSRRVRDCQTVRNAARLAGSSKAGELIF